MHSQQTQNLGQREREKRAHYAHHLHPGKQAGILLCPRMTGMYSASLSPCFWGGWGVHSPAVLHMGARKLLTIGHQPHLSPCSKQGDVMGGSHSIRSSSCSLVTCDPSILRNAFLLLGFTLLARVLVPQQQLCNTEFLWVSLRGSLFPLPLPPGFLPMCHMA